MNVPPAVHTTYVLPYIHYVFLKLGQLGVNLSERLRDRMRVCVWSFERLCESLDVSYRKYVLKDP